MLHIQNKHIEYPVTTLPGREAEAPLVTASPPPGVPVTPALVDTILSQKGRSLVYNLALPTLELLGAPNLY